MADIVMPRLSDSMEEGTILRWLKRNGDEVRRGEELVEIETDKASMTYESDQDGVLEIIAPEGSTLPIGQVIARTGAAAELPNEGDGVVEATGAPDVAGPASQTPSGSLPVEVDEMTRVKASPLARRVAKESGVPLAGIAGSGPGGRIVKADVQAAATSGAERATATPIEAPDGAGAQQAARAPAAATAPAVPEVMRAKGETRSHELSRTQQLIARRMAESKATIPHFNLQIEIDMEGCVGLRAQLAEHVHSSASQAALGGPGESSGATQRAAAPTYNDMAVKACALALREHPRVNGSYRDGAIQLHARVNVGIAVAVDAEEPLDSALVVPTVFDADIKSLGEIARESRTLAERVRQGTVTPPELSGGTFTVSNLGMFGVHSFEAIINPPQAAILSLGSLAQRPVVREGAVVAHHTMTATLSCDHRMLYGADAARFLARVRDLLEQPVALTL
jgi:pyruvate dehydrogenase E2 component (dihydrolipoamide acetyltransferase)